MSDREENTNGIIDKQRTKFLMIASALFMAVIGLGLSFFPQEIAAYFDVPSESVAVVFVKIIGGLYIGFALLNWMARSNIIGAIYSRPVAIGNFGQFLFVGITLLKLALSSHPVLFGLLGAINMIFAVCFGYILFSGGSSEGASCG